MTIRQYAKEVGHKVVGKLTRKTYTDMVYNYAKKDFVEQKTVYWVDEAGNEYYNSGKYDHPCIVDVEGGII